MAGERVLVVEDNAKNMTLFRDVLGASGYSVLEAATGERAVELAIEHRPNIVLMHIQRHCAPKTVPSRKKNPRPAS